MMAYVEAIATVFLGFFFYLCQVFFFLAYFVFI
jgi:hypothetical protein